MEIAGADDQKGTRFDQDLRFGSESIKNLFFLVKLLEDSGYDGPRRGSLIKTRKCSICWRRSKERGLTQMFG